MCQLNNKIYRNFNSLKDTSDAIQQLDTYISRLGTENNTFYSLKLCWPLNESRMQSMFHFLLFSLNQMSSHMTKYVNRDDFMISKQSEST